LRLSQGRIYDFEPSQVSVDASPPARSRLWHCSRGHDQHERSSYSLDTHVLRTAAVSQVADLVGWPQFTTASSVSGETYALGGH
jgi:hypothetical protein